MAITKTHLYDTIAGASCSKVAAWLQAHAVPDYFDTVAVSENGNSVICTVNGTDLLAYTPNTATPFVVKSASGASANVASINTAHAFIYYAFECEHGIAFTPMQPGAYDTFNLVITKNSKGETTILHTNRFSGNTNTDTINALYGNGVAAQGLSDVAPLKSFTFTRSEYELTTLVPFPCSSAQGDPAYTPDAFYMPHSQTTAPGKLVMGGVVYLSNGYWCVKDE